MRTSPHDVLLLRAALAPTSFALESWNDFCRHHDPQHLADGQTRLLPQVARNLAPKFGDASNAPLLRGLRKAAWVRNTVKVDALRQFLEVLDLSCDIVLLKGAAIFRHGRDTASRPVGDIDLFVPNKHLEPLLLQMENMGFGVRHLGTFRDVLERHRFRAIGCNLSHSKYGEIDVHWGIATNLPEVEFSLADQERLVMENAHFAPGISSKICGPQVLLAHTIQHLTRQAIDTDAVLLQALCDVSLLVRHSANAVDQTTLSIFKLTDQYAQISDYLRTVLDASVSWDSIAPFEIAANPTEYSPDLGSWPEPVTGAERCEPLLERPRLRRAHLYLAWQRRGSRPNTERRLMKLFGPFTRGHQKLCSSTHFSFERDCKCGSHVGIGWSPWIPTSDGVWSDRSDSRVVFRQPSAVRMWRAVYLHVTLGREWLHSPYKEVEVFANGYRVGSVSRSEREMSESVHREFEIPASVTRDSFLEISFRPVQFAPRRILGLGSETHRLGIALHSLAICEGSDMGLVR